MTGNGRSFKYDVFISHASEDVEWARKLAADLRDRGFSEIFLDDKDIHVADAWEPTLLEALDQSQHMVVIWSQHARDSGWVDRERGRFDAATSPRADPLARTRRLAILEMDIASTGWRSIQVASSIRKASAYAAGAQAVDPTLWSELVTSIAGGLRVNDPRIPVPVVVLAMDKPSAAALDINRQLGFGPSLAQVLNSLGLNQSQLVDLYSARRIDWRPLGSSDSIETILLKMQSKINARLTTSGQEQFRWDILGDSFWSNDIDTAVAATKSLTSEPASVVVVDPLSFFDQTVQDHFTNLLLPALNNHQVFFMVLPPFEPPSVYRDFKQVIKARANPIFQQFYEPELDATRPRAECALHISDEDDLLRMLLSSVGRQLYRPPEAGVPAYLRTSRR